MSLREMETRNTESDYQHETSELEEELEEEEEEAALRNLQSTLLCEITEANIIRYNVLVTEELRREAELVSSVSKRSPQFVLLTTEVKSSR